MSTTCPTGHLLESETYVGGHVECLQTGIYRNDIPVKFKLTPSAFQGLIDRLDETLEYQLVEEGLKRSDVTNYDEVRDDIAERLAGLRDPAAHCAETHSIVKRFKDGKDGIARNCRFVSSVLLLKIDKNVLSPEQQGWFEMLRQRGSAAGSAPRCTPRPGFTRRSRTTSAARCRRFMQSLL